MAGRLGTLSVVRGLKENAFTEADAKLLGQIGDQIAIAVENGLAYREIENLKTKLNKEKLYLEEEIRSGGTLRKLSVTAPR